MIYIIPTKGGFGVEIWGTYEDLNDFYMFIGKFWNHEDRLNIKGFENRDSLISGFSYEIRKAKDGNRLIRNFSHFSLEEHTYYGVKISWVHLLFTLTSIKFNMRYSETDKYDISQILLIEYLTEKAMISYDQVGAKLLIGFIEDGLYGGNEYIYLFMRSINLDFFILGGGKKAFRKLPNLLIKGVYYTAEYTEYLKFLENEAIRLNCKISELEINDDDFDYEKIKW